ncbi:hypothetical protein BEP19_01585 [Ammoniphilus oxalaticus]|uniref:serine-type D-Ala-D-Ala carboxypeptidase n=1 Tax=Ammoniphilus oxalaticus TaxID=66863 RepID=A0A419SMX9_9BACL|nr:D-alanyl-D-alanine carboxypeptidase family protein [Ammoniphilus oxalaticus]RKD25660.1 hypothetical protein BEP19_01585 [Ammoniphilus oxalaticus]
MKSRKGKIALLILCVQLLHLFTLGKVEASPGVSAQAAVLIDVDSGRILYDKRGNERMRVASLTKIMTAIVAIEQGDLSEIVSTPEYAVGTEGSSIYLRPGEKLSLEHLLYGLMLRSGNDVAVSIADHIGGSLEGFARLMNEKAEYIGLSGTHFTNPHGLDDSDNHYSTAADLAKLTAYSLKNPAFQTIAETKVINIPNEGYDWDRKLLNKNKMLHLYKGSDGVKTGYTKLAGRCLVSSATRDGRQLAVVTLNAPNDWEDHTNLLNYGFQQFTEVKLVNQDDPIKDEESPLYPINSFSYPLKEEERDHIRQEVKKESNLKQLLPGGVIGYLHLYLGDQLIGKIGLVKERVEIEPSSAETSSNSFFSLFKALIWGGI